ncbi:bacterial leucyl aminopeptidase [Dothidotthia symphoricarpi CBS 119687]|uniref:Peptide hydrolase n=1 Tax=Dothidotthia symphoricarpi CBS 119687 TaxID=1392245 RepID=A0A6A6A8U2_9PLEO|nr:bacterial leucyl aminopeptidase [Dothidotthia symphoricarpi CBS 119687]KAF2127071.1 bacterial leucyl aminopeptidase [Dothidotthia symphoricarpi CBS 119687]
MAFGAIASTGVLGLRFNEAGEELRLIKTSEFDNGTWYTEQEKLDIFISTPSCAHFMDITDSMELEDHRVAMANGFKVDKRQSASFPSAPSHQAQANPLIAQISKTNPKTWITSLTDIQNRYYRGSYAASSATTVFNLIKSVAAVNTKITVRQFTHSYNQPSVIATIPGTSANVVIVSSHFDSINQANPTTGRAPGADDNASAVVTILEALRVLAAAKYAPKNTLEFHFYSGEEGGLLGARAVMQDYVTRKVKVLALMNQDMTAYSPNHNIAVFTDYVSTPLTNYIIKLVPVYTTIPVITDTCGYACSDHGAATDAGFAAAYVADENIVDSSPYIHTANDAVSTLDFDHLYQHVRLTVGFLVEGSYF